jgi:uncharacterized membrane protein YuzA (DUF378 family)
MLLLKTMSKVIKICAINQSTRLIESIYRLIGIVGVMSLLVITKIIANFPFPHNTAQIQG